MEIARVIKANRESHAYQSHSVSHSPFSYSPFHIPYSLFPIPFSHSLFTIHHLLRRGVTFPPAVAELGLIDEYEIIVHPRLAGHGPTLFAALSKWIDLKLVSRGRVRLRGGGDAV